MSDSESLSEILRIRGSATESKDRFKSDANRRNGAGRILLPSEVGGDYDPSRNLETMLNGELRAITVKDLEEFKRRADATRRRSGKNRIQNGIRAKQVIKFATPSPGMTGFKKEGTGIPTDIQRANKEIHIAVLARANKGVLSFITNAGPDSKDVRHHVNVQLMSFSTAVSMPRWGKRGAIKVAKFVANEPLRFDCDCGRHTFWFRYIASIGGWSYGRNETGYPKIRNPKLIGVACKHVLRVVRELIGNQHIHNQIARMIESDRHIIFKQKEANEIAEKQRSKQLMIKEPSSVRNLFSKIGGFFRRKTQQIRDKIVRKPNTNKAKSDLKRMLAKNHINESQYKKMLKSLEQ